MTILVADRSRAAAAGQTSSYDHVVQTTWAPVRSDGGPRELVRAATLAANSHNSQPWRFSIAKDKIIIRPDMERRCAAVDPDDHHLFASLGCAAENVVHAAAVSGLRATPRFDAAGAGQVEIVLERAPTEVTPLSAAISERQSTRGLYDSRSAEADVLRALEAAGTRDGVVCHLITAKPALESILEYVVNGNTAQMRDPAFMAELLLWIRFNEAAAFESGDGLFARSSGNPTVPSWIGRRLLPFLMSEKSEGDKYAKQIRSSAGVAVFSTEANDRPHWVAAGRAYQHFALRATALGLKHAFINQPVEVSGLRPQFAAYLKLGTRRPDLVVRFGYGKALPRSLRRPVDMVIDEP